MAIGYGMLSDCMRMFRNSNCWNPALAGGAGLGALGLYLGGTLVALAAAILAGGSIARLFGKTSSGGSN